MNYLPFALLAYLLNGIALTVDKFLLVKHIPNPLTYIFYFSAISLIALIFLPFVQLPPINIILIASSSTVLWTAGAYFMFQALRMGLVSRVAPLIGVLTALILLAFAGLNQELSLNQYWGALLLILGLVFLTVVDWKGRVTREELFFELASSILFAFSYLLIRQAFLAWDDLSVFAWSRPILAVVGILILAIPRLRKQILTGHTHQFKLVSRPGSLFLFGQAAGGVAQLLILFAISLADPALINSLQGTQYLFLLVLSIALSRPFPHIFMEKVFQKGIAWKVVGVLLVVLGLYAQGYKPSTPTTFGLTFSPRYAASLGLNPQVTYHQILDELKPGLIRLPVYWDEVESFPNERDFGMVDYYLSEARKRGIKVILVLGYKQPRWPECFAPKWIAQATRDRRDQKTVELVQEEVKHFKQFGNIIAWQIENEPLFRYGVCIPPNQKTVTRVAAEIAVVRQEDPRPVIVTDGGELGGWVTPMKLADQFGTTLYRTVWSPYFGLVDYPLPPFYYTFKAQLVKAVTQSWHKQAFISELQAEPWIVGGETILDVKPSLQAKQFPLNKLRSHINFAQETGLSPVLLWGAEWWYWMKEQGYPQYWEYAKGLF